VGWWIPINYVVTKKKIGLTWAMTIFILFLALLKVSTAGEVSGQVRSRSTPHEVCF
jgi:hypothetical protein